MLNWIPYHLFKADNEWRTNWLFLGEHLFKEPFFSGTISACRRSENAAGRMMVATDLDSLPLASQCLETVAPTAFIFHISRCGSTMMTQLLSLPDENIVVSEPPLLDQLLRLKFQDSEMPDAVRLGYLKHAVHLIGQKRFENQQNYFIKWDCWHLFFLDEIRRIYPDVPFLFMTRGMDDIILSHKKKPGMQTVPGLLEPAIFGYSKLEVLDMPVGQYWVKLLENMQDIAITHSKKDDNSLLLQYENGVIENYLDALHFLGIKLNHVMHAHAINRLKFHSKTPKDLFQQLI